MPLYNGPIVDAHHHLWDFDPLTFPWLAEPGRRALAQSFGAPDYRAATAGLDIAGTVWIEALASDPVAEAKAAASLHARDPALCRALVAHAPLDAPDIESRLDRLAADLPSLRGIRDIVEVRPGHRSFARAPDLLRRPAFAAGLRALAERGLVFDLMLEPWQMPEALALALQMPELSIVVEHAGSPDLASLAGIALWRDAMRAAAAVPNVAVKISALHCRMPDWTDARLEEPILDLIALFGADRLAFGSDFPVHDLACPLAQAFESFGRAVRSRSAAEQKALFCDTARRLYRI